MVTENFKQLKTELTNHYETIQKYYFKNVVILKDENKIDIKNILNIYSKQIKSQLSVNILTNPKDEFRKIVANYTTNLIHTENSLSVYSMSVSEALIRTVEIINYIVTQITNKSLKIQDKQSKKELFLQNKQFKTKYSQRILLEIISEELKEICRINGILLQ
jgi:hypothetical protein